MHVKITVSGRVQGVGFRISAWQKATEYQLKGYVQNVGNDQVVMEVEGSREKVEQFIRDVRSGLNKLIRIDDMHIEEALEKGYHEFRIR